MSSINFKVNVFLVMVVLAANSASGHGFSLSAATTSADGTPTSFTASSEQSILDQDGVTTGPANLFLDQFSGIAASGSGGTYYPTDEGFAGQTWGSSPAYKATYNVLTPLYFADGAAVGGVPAHASLAPTGPTGTILNIYDLDVGDPSYPGASSGNVTVSGSASFYPGPGVSLMDFHELEKDLYIGSGPSYGEYGFAFNVTVHFANGTTVSSGPLVDVFAVSADSLGNFAANAPDSQQDAATLAIYKAAMADVSFDGIVNGQDIAVLASHWLKTGPMGQLPGDANRDGIVNGQDLALIAQNWEAIAGGGTGTSVPEPTAIVSAAAGTLGAIGLLRRRRHRS